MTALWIAVAWLAADLLLAPLLGLHLKHQSPTDAPQGRIGEQP